MAIKQGILKLQAPGRWAITLSGHPPIEITSGELFQVEVDGELKPTRMEFAHGQPGEYYFRRRLSVAQRAALGE